MIEGFLMNWTIIQQALPVFARGFELTLWLSLVGIVGSIIVGIIVSLVQYFKVPVLSQLLERHNIKRKVELKAVYF